MTRIAPARLDLAQSAFYPSGMIRAFLALPLPEFVAHQVSVVQSRLRLARPVPMEDFHVTLVFLDTQPEPVLEELHHAIEAMTLPALALRIDGLGTFGGHDPDALHARIAPDPRLTALQAKLARAARLAGVPLKARKFVPHVTLARFRHGEARPAELAQALGGLGAVTSSPWTPEALVLYRSTLRPEGPLYDPLARYPLTG